MLSLDAVVNVWHTGCKAQEASTTACHTQAGGGGMHTHSHKNTIPLFFSASVPPWLCISFITARGATRKREKRETPKRPLANRPPFRERGRNYSHTHTPTHVTTITPTGSERANEIGRFRFGREKKWVNSFPLHRDTTTSKPRSRTID